MRYTLGQAAKATGKSKTTIQRAVAKGLVSAEKGQNGEYRIDPAELHRIFPLKNSGTVPENAIWNETRPLGDSAELTARIKGLEEMLVREREALDEVRADRDAWKQQATALLSGPPRTRRWWPW
jgi:ArsR family metal-binding transcriptional regulator